MPERFSIPVRVYYEDTDAAGVVYYANYLKYLERARTEWLAAAGHPLAELERAHGIVFVVRRIEVDFRQPARLGDALDVGVTIAAAGRASLAVTQQVLRGTETIVAARVMLACVDRRTFRPVRIPIDLAAMSAARAGSPP
ncbi:MAG TPA: tol-pal system-associated acyl-CoA thioesterase [Casimicrobiaceae bacterium]|nr:tol-pal system-associated acyl-CoA thioesterase [Casimicrobiaceae bacterium]